MPVIVIVLMFLVAFLLAVIAMLAAPVLGVGSALSNRSHHGAQGECVSAFQASDLEKGNRY